MFSCLCVGESGIGCLWVGGAVPVSWAHVAGV